MSRSTVSIFHRGLRTAERFLDMDRSALKHLAAWTQSMEEALEVLGKLAGHPELKEENFTVRQAYLLEQFASVNASVLHVLEKAEQKVVFGSFKERRAYEKKVRDPDDCYLEVLQREKERRDRGLPPMIGILRGMRRATSEEILSDILDHRHEQGDEEEDSDEAGPNDTARQAWGEPRCQTMTLSFATG